MAETPLRSARLTIRLDRIVENWRRLETAAEASGARTGAAVKADAYGLGAGRVTPALAAAGCRTFFVATLEEARALAPALDAFRDCALYVLNGFDPSAPAPAAVRPVLNTLADARAWSGSGRPAALQIETGMNRLGAQRGEVEVLLADASIDLEIALVMSHLATADAPDDPLLAEQIAAFADLGPRLRGRWPRALLSLAASGGAELDRALHRDLLRPGVALYGGLPAPGARPVVRFDAPVLAVWSVEPGARSGYGGVWRAARQSRLATIGCGYADGFPRALADVGVAHVGGATAPFAGRVSMDLIVLDVTDAPGAVVRGDRAVLLSDDAALAPGAPFTVDGVATAAGTIGYEILTGLSRRAERVCRP